MSICCFIVMGVLIYPLCMRGGRFHDLLVHQAADILHHQGWTTSLEHPLKLPDGTTNFVDIYATIPSPHNSPLTPSNGALLIEVETTPRYAATNIAKAQHLNLPVWLLTPTHRVRASILNQLHLPKSRTTQLIVQGKSNPLCILLHAHLQQALKSYSSFVFPSECTRSIQGKQENNSPKNHIIRNKSPP